MPTTTVTDLPALMRTARRWVNWDSTKRPRTPYSGRLASVTDPGTWSDLATASERGPVGYVLGDGIGCVDLDHAVLEDGGLTPGATALVRFYSGSLIEVSPSGHGLHIWGLAAPQQGIRRTWRGQQVEFYSQARFITITGQVFQTGALLPL